MEGDAGRRRLASRPWGIGRGLDAWTEAIHFRPTGYCFFLVGAAFFGAALGAPSLFNLALSQEHVPLEDGKDLYLVAGYAIDDAIVSDLDEVC